MENKIKTAISWSAWSTAAYVAYHGLLIEAGIMAMIYLLYDIREELRKKG